jgi:hypothetical protein
VIHNYAYNSRSGSGCCTRRPSSSWPMWVQRLFNTVFTILALAGRKKNFAAPLLKPFYRSALPFFACRRERQLHVTRTADERPTGFGGTKPVAALCGAAA